MTLPEYAIRKKVTVVMVTLGLIVVGFISFTRLPQELFPPITFPQVTVVTDYVNAAPEEIEQLITKPIEESVGSVSGLKRIESVSREGRSTIVVSFNWGQDIDFAALAVREKIDLIKERLPKEAEDPVILKFDPLARPIMILSVTGKDLEPIRLKLLSEKMLKDNLEKVEGVASATISGGVDREILVEIDQGRLMANHLSLLDVIDSIDESNISYPAGSIKKGLYEYLIRTVGEFRSVKEIGYAVVGADVVEELRRQDTSFVEKGGQRGPRATIDGERADLAEQLLEKRLVLTRDIANIIDGFAEKTSISRFNGKENLSISIQKQAGANTIEVVDRLKKELEFLKEDVESRGLRYDIIYDHSTFIRQSLRNLFNEALAGGFLAFIILFLFLRSTYASLLVTVSIPITIMGVFFMMGVSGITLNIMSLGGLALAVGMIVDTSIVVLENIYRRHQLGDGVEQGAIYGAQEVMWAVIASNLTTIAVFFPLILFVPGILGQITKDLSLTVIFALVIAIIIPLTLVVMLSTYLKMQAKHYRPIPWAGILERNFLQGASRAKQNRFIWMVFLAVIGLCAIIFVIYPTLDREVLPKVDQGQFLVKVDMPIGTRLEITNGICKKIEDYLHTLKDVQDVATTIGSEKTSRGEVKIETLRPSQALILVSLKKDRKKSSSEIVQSIWGHVKDLDLEKATVDFIVQESEFQEFAKAGATKPIVVEVKGYDFDTMSDLVDRIEKKLASISGVMNIQDNIGEPSPETKLEIDKRRAALYGISALDISLTAKAAIDGVVATEYREGGKEIDVRVRLSEKDRENLDNINDLLLYSQVLDAFIPIKEVAQVQRGLGPSEIRRMDQERTVIVEADILKSKKTKDVLANVQDILKTIDVPQDFQVVLSGKAREIKESFAMVTFAFALSIMLVYMIMASLFESFVQPLIIMITVPLAFFGVAIALWLTGTSLNIISFIGIIVLGGVVVNNGIVLIEYINQLREEGMELAEATVQAAKIRTRPILMSALTTVVALIPLAMGFGEGAELRRPLAITVMGGLLSATFLTLIVVPCLYIFVVRLTERILGSDDEEEMV
ncbi:MAG: efflux RND transporter permease subunit [Candidatus Omnitrophica bacterium]|nr:efflux RND transporter permease subunit [Candidatus Omnitrophota bacterium]